MENLRKMRCNSERSRCVLQSKFDPQKMKKMENLQIMRRNSEKMRQNCAYALQCKFDQKKMENLRRELLQKCPVIRENCAKIVPMFYSARLVKKLSRSITTACFNRIGLVKFS